MPDCGGPRRWLHGDGWLAGLTLVGALLPAAAEPRLPEQEAKWAADAARENYVFVWDFDRKTIGRGDPYRSYRTLYDGLMFALSDARKLIAPGTPATVKLDPMASVAGWDEAYSGRLVSHETLLKGDPVVLHAEITKRDCDKNRTQVFVALSLAPRDDPGWKEMRAIRDGVPCDKSKS
jgi:hypothetical protein